MPLTRGRSVRFGGYLHRDSNEAVPSGAASYLVRLARLVAGVDTSTQSTKVIVVDAADGTLVAEGRAPHSVTGEGGARETDPRVWWDALRSALGETRRAADIAAIAIAGQQHGLVVLDDRGEPLRPATLWNDTRPAPLARKLTDRLGARAWAELTRLRPVASFTVAKWAW